MKNQKLLLLGCGILQEEIRFLIQKNNWPVDTCFLDSSLHVDFNALSQQLTQALEEHKDENVVVFYGACHPLMHKILKESKTFRTPGQNCIDILLGRELFMKELSNGAFFLIEDWAKRWEYITTKTFGTNPEVIKEIFRGDRKYLLCLNTPCSGDFSSEAKEAGIKVDLPLRWMDVGLEHMESVLKGVIEKKMKELECQKQ